MKFRKKPTVVEALRSVPLHLICEFVKAQRKVIKAQRSMLRARKHRVVQLTHKSGFRFKVGTTKWEPSMRKWERKWQKINQRMYEYPAWRNAWVTRTKLEEPGVGGE